LQGSISLVGWVDVGASTSVWRRFIGFYKKVRKIAEKKVCGKVMEYMGHPVNRATKFLLFFSNIRFMGIKRRRILSRFQKYQLKKKIFHNKGEYLGFSCF
jgi:late competence protein required for DNA uptake (superfamily II DNA/RNA helicase)